MMSYNHEVAIAIGGKPDAIKRFVNNVKQVNVRDKSKILDQFQIVHIGEDLAVFAVYLDSTPWCDEEIMTWKTLRTFARKSKLIWVFNRIGEDYSDIETSHSPYDEINNDNYDYRIFELFRVQRKIVFDYSELDCLK